mmetsp:Transcript_7346/g.8348  ORF Transcript_7346/g.8348 Transcript_7346/m.8348 type:complete len:91 (+) Transcript_7346:136-408(+)
MSLCYCRRAKQSHITTSSFDSPSAIPYLNVNSSEEKLFQLWCMVPPELMSLYFLSKAQLVSTGISDVEVSLSPWSIRGFHLGLKTFLNSQ